MTKIAIAFIVALVIMAALNGSVHAGGQLALTLHALAAMGR